MHLSVLMIGAFMDAYLPDFLHVKSVVETGIIQ